MEKRKTGVIVKFAKGSIVEISAKDILLVGENIKSTAAKLVNENGGQGIVFK